MVNKQLNQAKDVLTQLQFYAAHPEEAGCTDNCQRKMSDKEKEYRKRVIEKKRENQVSRIIRKSNEIDVLLYPHQNDVTVKQKLSQSIQAD